MAQVDINCSLDYDEMAAFLSIMDNGWTLDISPWEPSVLVATISPRNKAIRSKKPRRYPRLEILNTRRELAELELQVQILKEKHEFYESLKAAKSSCGLNWRLFALREQVLMKRSTRKNARLQKYVNDNNQLIQRISRLIQREPMPKSAQISCRIVNLDDKENVRSTMQASLVSRSKHQLKAIIKQCGGGFVTTPRDPQMSEWSSFAFGDRSVGVEFHECTILPFSAATINSAVGVWPSSDSFPIDKRITGELRQEKNTSSEQMRGEATESNQLLILQRHVQVRCCTIVLWEDAFCCESNTSSSSVNAIVRGSGWAFISPVDGHTDDLSVVHSGGILQINTTDQSKLQPSDQLSTNIVSYTQALQKSRMASLEAIILGSVRQQQTPI